jgi:hypothetical protein
MIGHYILEGKVPVKVDDFMTWAVRYQQQEEWEKSRVGSTMIGNVHVSTVFLGIDHNYRRIGPPILFETMIFGGEHSGYCERYTTWDEAEEGHHRACALVLS